MSTRRIPRQARAVEFNLWLIETGRLTEDGIETEELIEALDSVAANPQNIPPAQIQDLIHSCAMVIAALSQP
jgi:hypothetical protein